MRIGSGPTTVGVGSAEAVDVTVGRGELSVGVGVSPVVGSGGLTVSVGTVVGVMPDVLSVDSAKLAVSAEDAALCEGRETSPAVTPDSVGLLGTTPF